MSGLTAKDVRRLLDYDPETGRLTWRARTGPYSSRFNAAWEGKEAGHYDGRHVQLHVCGRAYYAHRLAWLYVTGEWPKDEIDHRDFDGANNRWANLREADTTQNNANRPMYRTNKSGLKGVSRDRGKKWRAQIQVRNKTRYLGQFDCPAAAHFAYIIAADESFGEYARA